MSSKFLHTQPASTTLGTDIKTWYDELHKQRHRIEHLPWESKRDLLVIHSNVANKITEIATETIECRRKQKQTARYLKLLSELDELRETLNQHIMLAKMIS